MSDTTIGRPNSPLNHPAVPLALVAVGFLPLLYWHIGGLLEKPHYQFLFLLPVALWILLSGFRWEPSQHLRRWEVVSGLSVLLIALAGLAVSSVKWSPWLAAVSFLLALFGSYLSISGWRSTREFLPIWFFLWIIVPLPLGMDEDLIIRLRGFTTRVSSSILDQIGVLHNSYANVIELPGKPLFIADACSGIHSLYVLMASALFLCAYCRRGFGHSIFLLGSTFGIVLIENVLRIVLVAWFWGRGWDLSEGTNHEMLGFALFAFSLFLILTTDQLLKFVFPPDAPNLLERIRQETNKGEQYYADATPKKRAPAAGAGLRKAVIGISAVFAVFCIVQVFNLPAVTPQVLAVMDDDFDLPKLGEDALPEEIAGFSRVDYSVIQRVHGDPFGQGSQQWWYEKDYLRCMISLDYPYTAPHDFTLCYENTGWTMENEQVTSVAVDGQDVPVAMADMRRPLMGSALLLFSSTAVAGDQSVALIKDLAVGDAAKRGESRWSSLFGDNQSADDQREKRQRTFISTQLHVRTPSTIDDAAREDLKQLFVTAQQQLVAKVKEVADAE
ncbi:MAG: hypothetical protein Fues2KO_26070 [Fuerstiella sp.]